MRCPEGWNLYKGWMFAAAEALRRGKGLGLSGKQLYHFQTHADDYQVAMQVYIAHLANCEQCKSAILAVKAE